MLARGVVFNVPVWSAVAESAALVNGRDPVGSVLGTTDCK